jgi:hypothetical protein
MQEDQEVEIAELEKHLGSQLQVDAEHSESMQWKLHAMDMICRLRREKTDAMAIVKRLESDLSKVSRALALHLPLAGSDSLLRSGEKCRVRKAPLLEDEVRGC